MRRLVFIRNLAALGIGVLLVVIMSSTTSRAQNTGAQPWGSWYLVFDISGLTGVPGAGLPTLTTLHQDGSLTVTEGTMFGFFFPGSPVFTSPSNGTWVRGQQGTIAGTVLGLRYDKTTGQLLGLRRGRFVFHFDDKNFDRIAGTLFVDNLNCGPLSCVDPFDPNAGWVTEENLLFTGKRIQVVPVGPLP